MAMAYRTRKRNMLFKKRLDKIFEANKEENQALDETEFQSTMEDEMEEGDLFAMIMGAYRFFLPLLLVLLVLGIVLLLSF